MSVRSDSSVATGSVTVAKQLIFLFVGAWFATAVVASGLGFLDVPNAPPIRLGLFVLLPTLALLGGWRVSPLVREAMRSIPLWKLVAVHLIRIEGAEFVIRAAVGSLPGGFGYVAGFGDLAAAVGSIPLAIALANGSRTPRLRTQFALWNAFGLLDLMTALSLGVLYSPSPFGLLHDTLSTGMFAHLPESLVPTFFVPALILTHLLMRVRMREELPRA